MTDPANIFSFPSGDVLQPSKPRPEPIYGGGNGGGPVDPTISVRDYIDKCDEAVESRLTAKLDKLPSRGEMWGMVGAVVGGVLGIVIAALSFVAFAGDRFDAGMAVSPTVEAAQKRQAQVDQKQDVQLQLMDQKLDVLIKQTAK